jgi:hypothetical protein
MTSGAVVGVALVLAATVPPGHIVEQDTGTRGFAIRLAPEQAQELELSPLWKKALFTHVQRLGKRPGPPQVRIVCGLTVITADPAIDPGFVLPIPEDQAQHKIRRIEPPVCSQ